jgi:hypothetical protein
LCPKTRKNPTLFHTPETERESSKCEDFLRQTNRSRFAVFFLSLDSDCVQSERFSCDERGSTSHERIEDRVCFWKELDALLHQWQGLHCGMHARFLHAPTALLVRSIPPMPENPGRLSLIGPRHLAIGEAHPVVLLVPNEPAHRWRKLEVISAPDHRVRTGSAGSIN